ncbi:anhydro-N-acetylmuramic acid kinase [Rhizobium sullae]|uniref:anhydro-N-acetylmuramic acid kinase n=1 Tax=Rhizobium sullae TaxID=50338 RepID=UPI000B352782
MSWPCARSFPAIHRESHRRNLRNPTDIHKFAHATCEVVLQSLGRPYDKDGEVASKGKVADMLMGRLKEHDFFKRPIPRSASRLDFGSSYLDRQMEEFSHLSTEDLLATLTEFAAYAITRSITDSVKMLSEISVIMASGRGTRNHYLMSRPREYMPRGLRLTTSGEFGVPAQFREAIKFATLAYATVNQLANNIPAASGATRFGILGKLVQLPRHAKGVTEYAAYGVEPTWP